VRESTGVNRYRMMMISGGLLWTRWWIFLFHKVREISWPAEELLAPQESLPSPSLHRQDPWFMCPCWLNHLQLSDSVRIWFHRNCHFFDQLPLCLERKNLFIFWSFCSFDIWTVLQKRSLKEHLEAYFFLHTLLSIKRIARYVRVTAIKDPIRTAQ
jgi:hypothetical protein